MIGLRTGVRKNSAARSATNMAPMISLSWSFFFFLSFAVPTWNHQKPRIDSCVWFHSLLHVQNNRAERRADPKMPKRENGCKHKTGKVFFVQQPSGGTLLLLWGLAFLTSFVVFLFRKHRKGGGRWNLLRASGNSRTALGEEVELRTALAATRCCRR